MGLFHEVPFFAVPIVSRFHVIHAYHGGKKYYLVFGHEQTFHANDALFYSNELLAFAVFSFYIHKDLLRRVLVDAYDP